MTKYTKQHEWIRLEGDVAVVGIAGHAQKQLGDVVFVELPKIGRKIAQGDEAAMIESVKAASEIYAPASGVVTEINPAIADTPTLVNSDAMGGGWLFKMALLDVAQLDGLMGEAAYKEYLGTL